MESPLRILHVFGKTGLGGAESRTMELYRNLDRRRIQFDFLVHADAAPTGKRCPSAEELMAVRTPDYFDGEIRELGGRLHCVPRFHGTNLTAYRRALRRFFQAHAGQWRAVQGHMTSTAAIYLPIAAKYGKAVTIAHVRSAGTDPGVKGIVTDLLRRPLRKEGTADYYFSCTEAAARHVYGDALVDRGCVTILPNAIDVRRFAYDEAARSRIRGAFQVGNAVVIGHVGRFHYAKNHEFLLRVFAALKRMAGETPQGGAAVFRGTPPVLMLLGEGARQEEMKTLAKTLHIERETMFLNNRRNVNEFYQAFDYFCFPSRYEGLPGTVIEAQAAGLSCLISDTITKEADATALVRRADIGAPPEVWARRILQDLTEQGEPAGETGLPADRTASAGTLYAQLCRAGFDVKTQAARMMDFYENGCF